jgi:hypothetical protein
LDRLTILNAANADFKPLIGIREVQDFEAKQQWPNLTIAASRWEFCKDVAAMANGGGGIIIYGLATQKLPAQQADETHAVHPIDPASVNTEMALGILSEHVHPPLSDIRIQCVPGNTLAPHGIVVLDVPPQNSKVLLCKTMEGTEAMKEYLFGFAERDRDNTRNWSRDEVVRMIKTGTDAVSARLEAIENTLSVMRAQTTAAGSPPVEDSALLKARIDEVLRDE